MSSRPEDDNESLGDHSNDSKRSSLEEQGRGLLGGWKEHDAELVYKVAQTQRKAWGWVIWIAFGGSILLAFCVSIGFVLALGGGPVDSAQGTALIRTNDYILDSHWDFSAPPQRREYEWTVRDHIHNPDGIYRPMLLVNDQYPGPLIEVNEGDTIVVHVDNQAVNATSIHWHGIYQNGTPHMDGTVGVTQCPIAPGGNFTYEFTVTGQSGTYWWHAHHGVQSSDGMHGPLIIHGRDERTSQRLTYATDRVLLVSDHYHDLSSALLWQYLKPDQENVEPIPEGGLLNGRNIRSCDEYPHRECDNATTSQWTADLNPNKGHRLRIINVGAFAEFQIQIDEHELAVTEVDGTDVLPVKYHRVNINPAQRYSVIISPNAVESDTFWLRARMVTQCFKERSKTLQPDVYGVIRYRADKKQLPTSLDWNERLDVKCRDMNTSELVPVKTIAAPDSVDAFFHFRANFEIGAWRLSRGVFDSSSWRADVRSPSLIRAFDGLSEGNASFAAAEESRTAFINDLAFDRSRELVVQTTGIQTIDILVENFDDGNHPLHLHGYKYFVLAEGHGYPPMKSVIDGITRENVQPLYDTLDLTNPLRRDTASVEGFGWILLRLVTDNPGAWAFHCHVSWHTEAGLLMQFLTRTDEFAKLAIPQSNRALCAAEGLERGMGPNDEDYRDLAK